MTQALCARCHKPFEQRHPQHIFCSGFCQSFAYDEDRLREALDDMVDHNKGRPIKAIGVR